MSALSVLIGRAARRLNDRDHAAWSRDRIRQALLAEAARLARQERLTDIAWAQAVAGQRLYEAGDGLNDLPPRATKIHAVLYDGEPIREAAEENLARRDREWESKTHRPRYWTADLGNLTSFRVSPAPVQTGDATPNFPPFPHVGKYEGNFLAFLATDGLPEEADEGVDPRLGEALEEVVVDGAVAQLTADAGDYGDLTKSAAYLQLARFIEERAMGV